MKFGSIDFDDAIGDALRKGKLVIFAGTGVSMGKPACMPSFEALAREISPGEDIKDGFIDRFLGDVEKRGVDVHVAAAEILNPTPARKPNPLQIDLLRLFRAPDKVRIVTTNFDLLFEEAAKMWDYAPETYSAPALPDGENFTGIIHIHGNVEKPRNMIVTDSDFGRAYMTQGGTVRFLVDLFHYNTVLFVGYSHDDTVMRYLSRSLPMERVAGRHGLTEEPKAADWVKLSIKPITFPMAGDKPDFSALNQGVHSFSDFYSRDMATWSKRIKDLCGRGCPPSEEAGSAIKALLRDAALTRLFVQQVPGLDWLKWLESEGCLKALFSADPWQDAQKQLAHLLACGFICR
jgi:hypothetical protein